MSTATELTVAEQLQPLREIAAARDWTLTPVDGIRFMFGFPARDSSWFWLRVDCNQFQAVPPAWHWYNPKSQVTDQPCDTPRGSGYFHESGVICAPWNRLAYKSCDPRGPHGDWTLANWMSNPNTRGCTTLAAMALRIFTELQSPQFAGRKG